MSEKRPGEKICPDCERIWIHESIVCCVPCMRKRNDEDARERVSEQQWPLAPEEKPARRPPHIVTPHYSAFASKRFICGKVNNTECSKVVEWVDDKGGCEECGQHYKRQIQEYDIHDEASSREPIGRDLVNHPPHYNQGKIEVIEFIEDQQLGFHKGNAVKYVCRAGKKDPTKYVQDLEKAIWYLKREIELQKENPCRPNAMR